jgi:hypothetical protein
MGLEIMTRIAANMEWNRSLPAKSDATSAVRERRYECALPHDEVGGDEGDQADNADGPVNGLVAVQPLNDQ